MIGVPPTEEMQVTLARIEERQVAQGDRLKALERAVYSTAAFIILAVLGGLTSLLWER